MSSPKGSEQGQVEIALDNLSETVSDLKEGLGQLKVRFGSVVIPIEPSEETEEKKPVSVMPVQAPLARDIRVINKNLRDAEHDLRYFIGRCQLQAGVKTPRIATK